MKKKTPLYLLTILMMVLSACSGTAAGTTASDVTAQGSTSQPVDSASISADFDDDDFTSTVNEAATTITLNGDSISAGAGVTVNGSTATITAAGTYEISGTLRRRSAHRRDRR